MAAKGSKKQSAIEVEVLISGGGVVGLSLAIALADAGMDVAVVDRADPKALLAAPYDGRSSAIARGSQQVFAGIGVWDGMADHAAPILDIRVSDGRVGRAASSLFLHYDHRDMAVQGQDAPPMGYIVENRGQSAPRCTPARLGWTG